MKKIFEDYLSKSKDNYNFFEELYKKNLQIDWQMTILFYSILCYIKAYFYELNEAFAEQMNSHVSIQSFLSQEKTTKRLGIFDLYYPIYCYSRDARYKYKKIKKFHIEDSLKRYYKIKELLKI